MSNAIEIHDLVKSFGHTRALDGVTMNVETGQVHGFLGPNGAGKSTTIRVLLGLLKAHSGTVILLGGDPWAQAPELHRHLAYVPGEVSLWPNLSGGEVIDLLARARGGIDKVRRDDLIARFDLDPRKKIRTYSKGNRQKVALVAALASNVELLILDEPTSGLDPLMARTFTDVLRAERSSGRTVLLSSHILSEVETVCDHVSLIKAGKIIESGTLANLRHLHGLEVTAELPGEVPHALTKLPGTSNIRVLGTRLALTVEHTALAAVLAEFGKAGVTNLTSNPPSLEELFVSHYETTGPVDQDEDKR